MAIFPCHWSDIVTLVQAGAIAAASAAVLLSAVCDPCCEPAVE